MATIDPVASQASYLRAAANLLAVSSPTASTFLGLARVQLVQDMEPEATTKELDTLRRDTCRACGNVMIPGWSCAIKGKSRCKQKERRTNAKTDTLVTKIVYCCSRCHRQTEQPLPAQPRRHLKRSKTLASIESTVMASRSSNDVELRTPKTANASSKQRQKARKGGLQAMLAKNKTQSSNQGLDLMDFAM
ncbi:hypothetical protein DE146DRAFT_32403 [Phaeosphaeria sp. MPI-PUGE-AT-0046c]|nr:hypothetical protein DE146DRAFT_32403 [Phaeosphaeria sp. MPI-PUGE-AT-0046c]